jgi:hypothetical protein
MRTKDSRSLIGRAYTAGYISAIYNGGAAPSPRSFRGSRESGVRLIIELSKMCDRPTSVSPIPGVLCAQNLSSSLSGGRRIM